MRLLISSDLHGSLETLRFILDRASALRPDLLVLLGDYVYHGPRNHLPSGYDTMGVLNEIGSLPGAVMAVRGNCDSEVDLALLPFPVSADAWLEADGLRIFASHGHRIPETPPMPGMFAPGTVFLRGHTHIPRAETLSGMHFWNPGSLSLPKGGFPPTYGWFEDGCFSVLNRDGGTVMSHRPRN